MKKLKILSAKNLLIMALAFFTAYTFSACSSSDDEEKIEESGQYDNQLIGTWQRTFNAGKGYENVTEEWCFKPKGVGEYHIDKHHGVFSYIIKDKRVIHVKMVLLYSTGESSEEEYDMYYKINGRTLELDNNTYKKK